MKMIVLLLEHPGIRVCGWTLIHFVWQAAIVASLAMILRLELRRASPRVRYLVLCGCLAVMVACPFATGALILATTSGLSTSTALTPVTDATPVTNSPAMMESFPSLANSSSSTSVSTSIVRPNDVVESSPTTSVPTWSDRLRGLVDPNLKWLVGAWGIMVVTLSLKLLAGWWLVQQLRHRHVVPVDDVWQNRLKQIAVRLQITSPIKLVESALVHVPTVIGWLRPMILLPTSFVTSLSPEQVESVLIHELAHIRRHDFLVNLLQTAIEVLLFYHPAVWWLSGRIREEREHCCDDIAVAVCGDCVTYVRALTFMEEFRSHSDRYANPPLTLAASGGSLVQRIRRLALNGTPHTSRTAWCGASLVAICAITILGLATLAVSYEKPVEKGATEAVQGQDNPKATSPAKVSEAWGADSKGIRLRIVPVPATIDDDAHLDLNKLVESFARADDVTFAFELKNVSEQPITLLGVRYGDSYATAAGKLNADFLGPHLFDLQITDANGKAIPRASRVYEREMLVLSGASAHVLEPGQSLIEVLRPARFHAPMDYRLSAGQYRMKVRYRGPDEKSRAEIKKHWPDHPQGNAWSHEAISNEVVFTIADDPQAPKPGKLVWGPAKDGLQAAIEFRRHLPTNGAKGAAGSPNEAPGVPIKSNVGVVFHVKNVSEKPITFSSETGRQGDSIHVTDATGNDVQVNSPWYSGWPIMVRWVLKPGETAQLSVLSPGVGSIDKPGQYTVRYTIRFNSMQTKDKDGNITFPLKDDWQSELETGDATLFLRTRTPEDEAREKPPTFIGRIEFVGPNGQPVDTGIFTVRGAIARPDLVDRPLQRGMIGIPDSTAQPATVTVRAAGYEEATFVDVKLKPNETKRFELTPALPVRLNLVSADQKPVVGAKIRFFNKTSGLASSGPIPMHGLEGPIWAESKEDGSVTIDSLQQIDPFYKKLGDAVYFFCIESPTASNPKLTPPPRIIGPVKAGQDLGKITLGPPLEIHGEIRGTAAELKQFAAEWDQPFAMKTDNPDATWDYTVSKRLETVAVGETLKFHLTGLTPGRFRIVANFGPAPKAVRHTYTRRDPQEGDTVVEVNLKESLGNLVITPAGLLLKAENK